MQGVSLTTARERGQLVVLEGLKSAVDIFFRPREEPHPLQFLRSVSPQVGPAPGLRVTPFSLPDVGGQSRLQKAGTARVSRHHSRSSPLSEAVCLSRKL